MARVYLTTTATISAENPFVLRDFERIQESAKIDRFQVHSLVESPEDAEIILFVSAGERDQSDILNHPLRLRYPDKCFLFESDDRTLPVMPGVYVCSERFWFPRDRFKTAGYLRTFENSEIENIPQNGSERWLYSFIGNMRNATVRPRLGKIGHPRGMVIDTSDEMSKNKELARHGIKPNDACLDYGKVISNSKFVLCPRGIGTSSWRLFEAMKAGRVPVILADDWVAPEGPQWSRFSVRLRERDYKKIPDLLERLEVNAADMGNLARAEWEQWFERDVAFHRIVDWCMGIHVTRVLGFDVGVVAVRMNLLRPYYFRHWFVYRVREIFRHTVGRWRLN